MSQINRGLPPQSRIFADPSTGRVDPLWYMYFRFLPKVVGNIHKVTSLEHAAATCVINVGNSVQIITSAIVQIIRSGKVLSSDPVVSYTTNVLTVSNGSSYSLTANDIINYIVVG